MNEIKRDNLLYTGRLKENAYKLRYTMTKAEACLWKYGLSGKQMNGYSFNRQRPINGFIVDFFCKKLKLVIEVDGYSHLLEEVIEKDKIKQETLEQGGFTVLRFNDNEVLTQIKQVKQAIWNTIEVIQSMGNPPPAPSGGGHKSINVNGVFHENKDHYFLEASPLLSPEEIQKGLWLVMAGVDDIPPHIALINEGLYYSVSAKKVETGVPIANFLKAISRRSVPTLFIKFRKSAPLGDDLGGAFQRYPTLGNGEHSCLWPVRDVFAKLFSENYIKASLVFELLVMAQEDDSLVECKALFLEQGEGRVRLPKYTHTQIREKINSILKVNE